MEAPRRGRTPTVLTGRHQTVLDEYAVAIGRADMTPQARRTYLSRVRVYLAWLADTDVDGDPFAQADAAAWAARDYKAHLPGFRKLAPSATPPRCYATLVVRWPAPAAGRPGSYAERSTNWPPPCGIPPSWWHRPVPGCPA
jgi:hypothetical protein